VRHTVHEPLEDRVVEALRIDDDAAQVEVHDGDAFSGLARSEPILHQRGEHVAAFALGFGKRTHAGQPDLLRRIAHRLRQLSVEQTGGGLQLLLRQALEFLDHGGSRCDVAPQL
jgi:hypothetical protein